jgi:hypothetical protein
MSEMFDCRHVAFIPGLYLAEGTSEKVREDSRDSSSRMIFNGWLFVEDDRVNSGTLRARAVQPRCFNILSPRNTGASGIS